MLNLFYKSIHYKYGYVMTINELDFRIKKHIFSYRNLFVLYDYNIIQYYTIHKIL